MKLAFVIGSTISTLKDENLSGKKLLILREADTHGQPIGQPFIAVDTVSAGTGDLVLVATGSAARYTQFTKDSPIDATIVGVIDSLEESGKVTFRKS